MNKQLGWALWLLMALTCSASEIVAWKMPLNRIVWNGLDNEGLVRSDAPPEPSPFFNQGDELWELEKRPKVAPIRPNQMLSAEWVVWNATSDRIVAKGDWNQISALNHFLRPGSLPIQTLLTASLLPVKDSSRPVSKDTTPIAEVSLLLRHGHASEATWSEGENSIEVEAEVYHDESLSRMDVRLVCFAKVADQDDMHINTAFSTLAGSPVWVARDFDGNEGFDLVVSAEFESLDGIPVHERVMIQHGEIIEPLKLSRKSWDINPVRAGDDDWMVELWVSTLLSDVLSMARNEPRGEEADPFAAGTPEKRMKLPESSPIKPPPALHPWLRHEVLDAREWFVGLDGMPQTGADDFIGYEPISGNLFVYSSNHDLVEFFSMVFMFLDGEGPANILVTTEFAGQTRLIGRSGQKASMHRNVGGEALTRRMEIEPTMGENQEIMDLRLVLEDQSDPARNIHSKAAVILQVGEWMEIGAARFGEGEKSVLRVKPEIMRIKPGDS